MHLFQLLGLLEPRLHPAKCKIHLAVHNGTEDPIDVYVAGKFDAWQAEQNNPNFQRDHVVSLIALPEKNMWLFVGAYQSLGWAPIEETGQCLYNLEPHEAVASLQGRLVVSFARSGRQSYLLAENWADRMLVSEIRPTKLTIAEFPGYSWALLTKQQLDTVVDQQVASWKGALASVGGVYVIADRNTGKLYVGSATGREGLWSRWCTYSATGHGNNRDLVDLLREQGPEYAEHFQFSVLEIADTHACSEDILRREAHWKRVVLSREHGHNAN